MHVPAQLIFIPRLHGRVCKPERDALGLGGESLSSSSFGSSALLFKGLLNLGGGLCGKTEYTLPDET